MERDLLSVMRGFYFDAFDALVTPPKRRQRHIHGLRARPPGRQRIFVDLVYPSSYKTYFLHAATLFHAWLRKCLHVMHKVPDLFVFKSKLVTRHRGARNPSSDAIIQIF